MEKTKNQKVKEIQQKTQDVIVKMQENVRDALDRDEKLNALEVSAEELEEQSRRFREATSGVRWRFQCAHYKTTAALILIVLAIILAVVLSVWRPWESSS